MCSLADNKLQPEGAKHVADAIATNTTLKELKYALSRPQPCCQYRSDACCGATVCNTMIWTIPPSSKSKKPRAAASHCGSKLGLRRGMDRAGDVAAL